MIDIPNQFSKNFGVMNDKDFLRLQSINVLIVGVGGLGGNVSNLLTRLGVKNLSLVDYDTFDESNLNRQLFSNKNTIGKYKVDILKKELLDINNDVNIENHTDKIQNIDPDILLKFDYIIDAVDNPKTKIYISELGSKLDIPVLHGACAGWYGQIGWILPGCNLIKDTYQDNEAGLESELHNPSFTPAATASYMVSEFLKMIQGSDQTTINKLLLIDLLSNSVIKTNK